MFEFDQLVNYCGVFDFNYSPVHGRLMNTYMTHVWDITASHRPAQKIDTQFHINVDHHRLDRA